jgi:cysteine desulfurase
MLPYFSSYFGNTASRTHYYGLQAERAVEIARKRIAALISAYPEELVFTSGATESINLALKGLLPYAYKKNRLTLPSSPTEHKAVLDTLDYLTGKGIQVKWLRVNPQGIVEPDELKRQLDDSVFLVSLMYVNNETGVLHPISE